MSSGKDLVARPFLSFFSSGEKREEVVEEKILNVDFGMEEGGLPGISEMWDLVILVALEFCFSGGKGS